MTERAHCGGMTTTTALTTVSDNLTRNSTANPATATYTGRLRLVLTANAATSAIGGAVAAVATDPVARLLGVDSGIGRSATRLVGLGLIVFAAVVAYTVRAASPSALRRNTVLITGGDVSWVLATVVILATGTLSSAGTWIAVAMGIAVADFAILQMWTRRRAFATGVADAQPT